MTNAIRPDAAASLLGKGEAQTRDNGKPGTLKGSVLKRCRGASGGWRRNDEKVGYMNQGDLTGVWTVFMPSCRRAGQSGVRATIVVTKRGNARGAKGRRKVDAKRTRRGKLIDAKCPINGLNTSKTSITGTSPA